MKTPYINIGSWFLYSLC